MKTRMIRMVGCSLTVAALFMAALCRDAAMAQTGSELANERAYQATLARERQEQVSIQAELAAEAADVARRQAIREKQLLIERTVGTFPWRVVDGETQHVAVTWCVFSGRILQVIRGKGILVDGQFHSIYPDDTVLYQGDFFVKHYPFEAADDDAVPDCMAGAPCDVYSYTTVMGAERSVHCLDFGIPCGIPDWALPRTDPDAARKAAESKKEAEARILTANEAEAANGDPYGLLRMGERYRDGDGVETNLDKARDYFKRAAMAGDSTASNDLVTLDGGH